MYGFLRPDDAATRRAYRVPQCSLCHRLGADYRARTRWLAGYDPTALVLLIEGLAPEPLSRERVRCPIPLAPRRRVLDPSWAPLEAIAALQLFLAGEKLHDDALDGDRGWKRAAGRLLTRDIAAAEDALRRLGFPVDATRETLRRQPGIEADPCADLDALSAPTGDAFAALVGWLAGQAAVDDPRPAAAFGRALGHALYLVDGLVDWKGDRRRGRFNPIDHAVGDLTPATITFLSGALEGRARRLERTFLALPLRRHRDVLEQTVVHGLPERGRRALERLPSSASLRGAAHASRP